MTSSRGFCKFVSVLITRCSAAKLLGGESSGVTLCLSLSELLILCFDLVDDGLQLVHHPRKIAVQPRYVVHAPMLWDCWNCQHLTRSLRHEASSLCSGGILSTVEHKEYLFFKAFFKYIPFDTCSNLMANGHRSVFQCTLHQSIESNHCVLQGVYMVCSNHTSVCHMSGETFEQRVVLAHIFQGRWCRLHCIIHAGH